MLRAVVTFLVCMAILVLCHAVCHGGQPAAAEIVHSTDRCPACDKLEAEIKANKIKVVHETTTTLRATYFPCVVYSDGHRDSGDRIYAKKCMFRVPLKIIKYKPKED